MLVPTQFGGNQSFLLFFFVAIKSQPIYVNPVELSRQETLRCGLPSVLQFRYFLVVSHPHTDQGKT